MRIGIDCRLWNETGVGRYTRNLIHYIADLDKANDYILFALGKDIDEIKALNLKFKIVQTDIRWHSLSEQVSFARVLGKEALDLMHFPYFSVPVFYRKPFVITIHDLILNHYPTGKASTLIAPFYWVKHVGYRFVIAQAAARARKIITVSQETKSEIVDHLGVSAKKIEVVYEGVDEKISNIKNQKSNKFQNEKYFLYVGNAYPHKNLELLIDAFKKVQEKNKDVSLVLVGKEDFFYKKLKEKIKQLDLETKVLLFGYATDEELGSLYSQALAFVYPSKMEGFGLPLIEALANNCVVIASDIPVFREIVGNSALYFTDTNPEELAQKMEQVLSGDKGVLEKLKKSGKSIIQKYSWEKMAQETLAVYNSCF